MACDSPNPCTSDFLLDVPNTLAKPSWEVVGRVMSVLGLPAFDSGMISAVLYFCGDFRYCALIPMSPRRQKCHRTIVWCKCDYRGQITRTYTGCNYPPFQNQWVLMRLPVTQPPFSMLLKVAQENNQAFGTHTMQIQESEETGRKYSRVSEFTWCWKADIIAARSSMSRFPPPIRQPEAEEICMPKIPIYCRNMLPIMAAPPPPPAAPRAAPPPPPRPVIRSMMRTLQSIKKVSAWFRLGQTLGGSGQYGHVASHSWFCLRKTDPLMWTSGIGYHMKRNYMLSKLAQELASQCVRRHAQLQQQADGWQ